MGSFFRSSANLDWSLGQKRLFPLPTPMQKASFCNEWGWGSLPSPTTPLLKVLWLPCATAIFCSKRLGVCYVASWRGSSNLLISFHVMKINTPHFHIFQRTHFLWYSYNRLVCERLCAVQWNGRCNYVIQKLERPTHSQNKQVSTSFTSLFYLEACALCIVGQYLRDL